jgi:CRP-like cAMP-binding protein
MAVATDRDKANALVADPAFRHLPREATADILRVAELRSFEDGQRLCSRGEDSDGIYIIVSGNLCLSATTEDGRQHVIDIYSPGVWIGESSVLDQGPRACDTYAVGPTVILQLHPSDVETLMQKHYAVARALLRLEAARLRTLVEVIQINSARQIESRLAFRLLHFCRTSDKVRDVGSKIEIELTQETIASMIGSTRQRVNQLLRQWRKEGLVELTKSGRVNVCDRERLAEKSKF